MQKNGERIEKLPPVLTLARVAEIAGVSRRTVRRWVLSGRLASKPVGQRRYFDTEKVLRLLGVEVNN